MVNIINQISKTILLCCYLLSWENHGYTKCCILLSVGIFHWSRTKFLIGNFTGVPIMNFIWDWESQIVNQSGLQIDSSENWCHCEKMRAFLKKNSFTEGFFFQASSNLVRKRKVYKAKVVTLVCEVIKRLYQVICRNGSVSFWYVLPPRLAWWWLHYDVFNLSPYHVIKSYAIGRFGIISSFPQNLVHLQFPFWNFVR